MSKTFLHSVFTLYLALLFCAILPAHTHEDGEIHEECTLCVLFAQPAITTTVFIYCTLAILLVQTITILIQQGCFRRVRFYPTRAPPFSI